MAKSRQVKVSKTEVSKAQKSIKTYQKNLQKGTEKHYSEADKAIDTIQKYLNKDGSISKSKTRTKKAKEALNAAVNDYNRLAGTKTKRSTNRYNQTVKETADKIQKQDFFHKSSGGGVFGGLKSETAARIFMDNTLPKFKQFSTSEAVLALIDSGFSEGDIYDILDYLNTDLNMSTPDELSKFASDDDVTVFIDHIVNLHDTDPDIPADDIIMMAQQMTDYGLDDYDSVINDWYD